MKSKYLFLKGMTQGRQDLTLEFGKIRDIDTDEFNSLIADEKLQDKLSYEIEKVLGLHKSKKCWIIENTTTLDIEFVTFDKKVAKKYSHIKSTEGFPMYHIIKSKIK